MNQQTLSTVLIADFQEQTIADVFSLEPNRMDIGSKRLLLGIGVFVIPTLIINAIFYTYLELTGTGLLLATSIIALVLLNLTIYLLNKIIKGNRTLIFGYNELKILENAQPLYTIPFEALKVTLLSWEISEGNYHPAIQLSAKELPCMMIGCKVSTDDWQDSQKITDCTAFIITTEVEWKKLIKTLEHFINQK